MFEQTCSLNIQKHLNSPLKISISIDFIFILLFGPLIITFFVTLRSLSTSRLNYSIFLSLVLPDFYCNCDKAGSQRIIYSEIDEITFISVPNRYNTSLKPSMKVAISSWLASSPKSHVILFIDRKEFDNTDQFPEELEKIFGKDRVTYIGNIRKDLHGIPYINEWFIQGVLQSRSKYMAFINADIIVSSKWLKRVKQVYSIPQLKDKPLVLMNQRIDFDLKKEDFVSISFTDYFNENNESILLNQIESMIYNSTHRNHSPDGIDCFTFRKDKLPFDPTLIPPFIIGRFVWDNWLVGWLNTICDTVTFHTDPPIYHVNHIRHVNNKKDPRVAVNFNFMEANNHYLGTNTDTKWEVKNDALIERHGSRKYYLGPL